MPRRLLAVVSALALVIAPACAYPDFSFDEGTDDASVDGGADARDGSIDGAHDVVPPIDGACPAGWMLCGSPGTCVDVKNDASHCGSCTTSCASGKACISGACGCPTGTVDCFGTCTDTTRDPAHCGVCSTACPGAATCSGGACACPAGSTNCAGFCTELSGDSLNCGSCGHACNWDQYCKAGTCVCRPGWVMCGGFCTDIDNDPFDCGACGRSCGSACAHGSCVSSCPTDEMSCNTTPPGPIHGCVPKTGDVNNCGACGTSCDAGSICTGGACHDYYPAVGCTSCPCAACPSGYSCCVGIAGLSGPYCVAGTTCT